MTERAVRCGSPVLCAGGSYPGQSGRSGGALYGVSIDESRIFVDYQYIASNLMPDITVLPATGAGIPFWNERAAHFGRSVTSYETLK